MTAQIGGGRVEFELDGKPVALVPSLEACLEISKMAGGLAGALDRCRALNFDAICAIVGASIEIDGVKLNPGQRAKLLPKAIYEAGVFIVAAHCMDLIRFIGRGPNAPDEDEAEEGEAGEQADAPLAQ